MFSPVYRGEQSTEKWVPVFDFFKARAKAYDFPISLAEIII